MAHSDELHHYSFGAPISTGFWIVLIVRLFEVFVFFERFANSCTFEGEQLSFTTRVHGSYAGYLSCFALL